METKLSLLSEENKQLFADSMNEIHDMKLSFEEWLLIAISLSGQVIFFFGINSQEKINQQ